MSRAATGDTVVVKPVNNVYTVLVLIAIVAEIIGFVALFLRHADIFPGNGSLFS